MQQYRTIYGSSTLNKRIFSEELPKEALELREKLSQCGDLRELLVPWNKIQKIVGISRSSYYRIKKSVSIFGLKAIVSRSKRPHKLRQSSIPQEVVDLVLSLRKANPTYGKSKIVVLLKRDHKITISESGVGRILDKLFKTGKVVKYHRCRYSKRKRQFKNHAKRWQYTMKAKTPGEMVQLDHMSVSKNNISFKHFKAWDPITKTMVADIFSNAKSRTAAKFLHTLIEELPFAVKSIQVDGGSEFMKDFEEACAKLNIPLYVLPPKSPKYNGGVERGNRIFRDEFYARKDLLADSIVHLRHELKKAVVKYNTYRPHFNLQGDTPYAYYNKLSLAA